MSWAIVRNLKATKLAYEKPKRKRVMGAVISCRLGNMNGELGFKSLSLFKTEHSSLLLDSEVLTTITFLCSSRQ